MVTVHEVVGNEANSVMRVLVDGEEEAMKTIESVSGVYEEGKDAVIEMVKSRFSEKRLTSVKDTFNVTVDNVDVDSDYGVSMIVEEIQSDGLTYLMSHTPNVNIRSSREENKLEIHMESPVIL